MMSFTSTIVSLLLPLTSLAQVSRNPSSQYIDLTYSFNNETVLWPGRNSTIYTEVEGDFPQGFWMSVRGFCTSEHTSTHIDAPAHFNKHGRRLHEIPMEDLIDIPGVLIDIYDKVHKYKSGQLEIDENYGLTQTDILEYEWELKNGEIPPRSVVLLRTGWEGRWGNSKLFRGEKNEGSPTGEDLNFPSFDISAAKFLASERQILGVGVDVLSVDTGNEKTFRVHQYLAMRNLYSLELVANLHLLPPTGFSLWMIPFKIDSGTGAPTRVLAKVNARMNVVKKIFNPSQLQN